MLYCCYLSPPRENTLSAAGVPAGCLSKSRLFSASVRGKKCEHLYIEILHQRCVLFDELAAQRGAFAHENGEHFIRLHRVAHGDAHERTGGGVHGGIPELFGAHFTETLVQLILHFIVVRRVVGGLFLLGIEVHVLLALDARLDRKSVV